MQRNMLQQAVKYSQRHRRKKWWQKAVTGLAAVAVLGTANAMMLPAVTMEQECPIPEHIHTQACYTQVSSTDRKVLKCGAEGLVVHQHDAACYDEDGNCWCPLPEIWPHTHCEECYLIPETEAPAVHQHTDACYTEGELTCTESTEPVETEPAEPVLVCTQQEIFLHTHDAACFDGAGNVICGKTQVLTHTHTEECWEQEAQVLTCQLPEDENHTHNALCYGVWELTCGMEEHTHTLMCYADPNADTETAADWEATLPQQLTGEWAVDVLTIAESQLGYKESNTNYQVAQDGTTKKGYTRYGAWYGDPYGDWCAMFVSFCLHYANVEHMPIASGCGKWIAALSSEQYDLYRDARDTETTDTPAAGELVFFDWQQNGAADHVGLVAELIPATQQSPAQIKTIEGNSSDQVQYVTYELDDPTIMGFAKLPEQTFYCGKTGHIHDADCTDLQGQVICGLEEHIHTENCETEAAAPVELTAAGEDYMVSVRYGPDAALPDGVELVVEEISPDSIEYQRYYGQAASAMDTERLDQNVVFARFFDISFRLDGVEYEPAAPVEVTITYTETPETDENAVYQAIHFTDAGTEVLPVTAETGEDGTTSFTHVQESFSVVGNVVPLAASYNPADNGPDRLPVYYYVCIDDQWVLVGATRTGWYYQWDGVEDWSDYNRDYITAEQAVSILGQYGFTGEEADPSRVTAYQQKSGSEQHIFSDTQCVEIDGQKVLPLSRNTDHAGYNLYYLPSNADSFAGRTQDELDKTANGFYTVKVFDGSGELLTSRIVETGGSFTYDAAESGVTQWLAAYGSGSLETLNGTTIALQNITSPVVVSPKGQSQEVNHTVTFKVMVDTQWETAGTLPYYYTGTVGGETRACITSDMAAQFFGKYGYTSDTEPGKQFGYSAFDPLAVSNDTLSAQNADGTYTIGLTRESNTDIVCYYLPYETAHVYTDQPESALSPENTVWSVKVTDNSLGVYSLQEQQDMTRYAPNGGAATITVRNGDGILWSCVGKNGTPLDVTETQEVGHTTFVIQNITQPVEVTATMTDPSFTVQYYAVIPRLATSGGSDQLAIIDTSAASNGGTATLPRNGVTPIFRQLQMEKTGGKTNQNAGVQTDLYRVMTAQELTKMYSDAVFQYEASPGLEYFNKLKDNENFSLAWVGVLKEGKDPANVNDDDWQWYPVTEAGIGFTNLAAQANDTTILVEDGAVIRLWFQVTESDYYNSTTFYDYDISKGYNNGWLTGTGGINSETNYGTSDNGQRNWHSNADVFAFGNENCGTGMSGYQFDGGALNKYNSRNAAARGCTFGLAESLNSDGTINYNDWLVVPNLFNDGDAAGKQTYPGSSLTFQRVGDHYTLTAATLKTQNSGERTIDQLQYFFHPSPASNIIWDGKNNQASSWQSNIYTNNFWPMDGADSADKKDGLWGKYGSTGYFQGFAESNSGQWTARSGNLPSGDDGYAHNWFFGMNFALSFHLTEDYEGPLEYCFFGDDDLWVFLDNRLICDIGGVHSSVGEYVDLRDYLPVGSSGQHTLSFFYTERGASGSTCYMSFTLPSVTSATTFQETGSLQICKTVDADGADFSSESYAFLVELLTDENGKPLNQTFSYSISDGTTTSFYTIQSGKTIFLKAGQTATISGIPAGTFYRVTEAEESRRGYATAVNGNTGYVASGSIATGTIRMASFVNTPFYELPDTGGAGTHLYTMGGLTLLLCAGFLLLYNNSKRRKEASASS